MLNWLKKLVGDTNEKAVRKLDPLVEEINDLEEDYRALSDAELRAKTDEFRQRLRDGETLDDLLPEAFATVREVSRRTIGMRHYDVQLIGGAVLHQGNIAEMKTGEGKTLVATLPLYLNALEGKGCHLITVNDYLARRDAGWMGPVYDRLGMKLGFVAHSYSALFDPEFVDPDAPLDDERLVHWRPCKRREAYAADITYGTNNEFGFDYLRDNMVNSLDQMVQRKHNYGIVDEVDNVLIDEARTPLIISGPASKSSEQYARFAQVVRPLRAGRVTPDEVKKGATPDGDLLLDPKTRTVVLTEDGMAKVEAQLDEVGDDESVYDPQHSVLTHYLENALKAQFVFHRDKDYVVQNGEVVIVDEFTGRMMPGRRWSDGLHQAVEAKEGVDVKRETVTYATITFQNYFRKYAKLAGMTGTAETEKEEFGKIYNLEVVVIPTNKPVVRDDISDQIYRTEEAKFNALTHEIRERTGEGQPILVGTASVETSERLSALLKREKIPHQVLNAKQNVDEARIVAQAGRPGVVTIATNMAGRGTDILLGGNVEALASRYLEEVGMTQEQLNELSQSMFGDPKTRKLTPQQLLDRPNGKLTPDLYDALTQLHAEYEQILQRVEEEGMQVYLVRTLLDDTPDKFNQNLMLVNAVLNRRLNDARQLVEETPWLDEEQINEISRVNRETTTYKTASERDRANILAERVFQQIYTNRARVVQLTLHNELDRARALAEQIPGLKPDYVDDVLRIKRECEEQRERVKEVGGLHIVGTERHEARRIDNQLRGRAGRQGDPGSSMFYLSLEDDLMRRFGRMDTIKNVMERMGVEDDVPIEAKIINRSIESAQTRVEGFNFDMRKHTVDYDNVMNKQREVIYDLRSSVLGEANEHKRIAELFEAYLDPAQMLAATRELLSEANELDADEARERLDAIFPDVAVDLDVVRATEDEALPALLEPQIKEQQQHSVERLLDELSEMVDLPEDADAYVLKVSHDEAAQYIDKLWREQTSDDLEARIKELFENEFGELVDRYLVEYETWLEEQIRQAVADALNPATDAVNVRLVQRRLSAIMPEVKELDLEELETLADNQLQRRLEDLIPVNYDRGHNIELLAGEIRNLIPSLLPDFREVVWLNMPATAREQFRDRMLDLYQAALQSMTTDLDEADRTRLVQESVDFVRQTLRPIFAGGADLSQQERQAIYQPILTRNAEVLQEILHTLEIDAVEDMLANQVDRILDDWRTAIGVQNLNRYQQSLMLQTIDMEWQQYLTAMEDMRQGIGLQAIGQRDPLVQYQTAGYRMFGELLANIDHTIVRNFFRQLPAYRQQIATHQAEQAQRQQAVKSGYEAAGAARTRTATRQGNGNKGQTLRRKMPKVGRNDPCPCGSGKKYKHCCGRTDADIVQESEDELVETAVAQNETKTAVAASPAPPTQPAQPAARGRTASASPEQPASRGRGVPTAPAAEAPKQRGRSASNTPKRGKTKKK